jgi:O-antigen biosynthesis protein
VFYALLSEAMRFSRAIVLIGTVWTLFTIPTFRYLLHFTGIPLFRLHKYRKKRIILAGSIEECNRVEKLLQKSGIPFELSGFINTNGNSRNEMFIGSMDELPEIVQVHKTDEIIFCSRDIPSANVIRSMVALSAMNVDYKIAGPESIAIIGSNSIDTSGDLYEVHFNSIATEINRRNKRLFDIVFSLLLLGFLPVMIFISKKPLGLIINIFQVLIGLKTWVGYIENERNKMLPSLKKSVLHPEPKGNINGIDAELAAQLNLMYAKDYRTNIDIAIIFKKIKHLGS